MKLCECGCRIEMEEFDKRGRPRRYIRRKEILEQGFNVIRLKEHDIRKMELNDFEKLL